MKKNRKMSLTLAAALALTALTACGSMSASAAIDAAAAKQIAADHLGVNVSDLKVLECERDDGKYELEVLVGDVKYDFVRRRLGRSLRRRLGRPLRRVGLIRPRSPCKTTTA